MRAASTTLRGTLICGGDGSQLSAPGSPRGFAGARLWRLAGKESGSERLISAKLMGTEPDLTKLTLASLRSTNSRMKIFDKWLAKQSIIKSGRRGIHRNHVRHPDVLFAKRSRNVILPPTEGGSKLIVAATP
jgi:hypothetical protein